MRHHSKTHSFGRRPDARAALLRGLVDSIVLHERIKTTVAKAKELRKHVEKAITYGKKGGLHTRRILLSSYPNKDTVAKILAELSPRFKDRPGGYTRIIKLGARPGDQAEMAFIEFVDYKLPEEGKETEVKGEKKEAKVAKKGDKKQVEKKKKGLAKKQKTARKAAR